jgi:hypothetical protein
MPPASLDILADAAKQQAENEAVARYQRQLELARKWKKENYLKYENDELRNKKDHAKGVKEYSLDYYKAHKQKINERRRARYAVVASLAPKRPRGRPAIVVANPPSVYNAERAALGYNTVNVYQELKSQRMEMAAKLGIQKIKVPIPDDLPEKFRKILGSEVSYSPNVDTWYFKQSAVMDWLIPNSLGKKDGGLQNKTKIAYITKAKNLLRMDYAPLPPEVEKDEMDPFIIAQWTLKPKSDSNPRPFDLWTTIRRIFEISTVVIPGKADQGYRFNENTSPLSAIWSAQLNAWTRDNKMPDGNDFDTLGMFHIVMGTHLGRKAHNESHERHQEQKMNERVQQNIMNYTQYRSEALEYISRFYTRVGERYNLIRGVALADARAAAATAAYIYITPKRNDWYCMEVADGPLENKLEERNVIVFSDGGASAVVYWQRFKNSAAFLAKGMLPLKEEIPMPLATLLWGYHQALKAKGVGRWLFPRQFKADAPVMNSGDFGDMLGSTSEIFTTGKKRISSSILRIMYITWWHTTHNAADHLKETIQIMYSLHQTDIRVHLGYKKRLISENVAAGEAEIRYIQNMIIEEANTETTKPVEYDKDDDPKVVSIPKGMTTRSRAAAAKPIEPLLPAPADADVVEFTGRRKTVPKAKLLALKISGENKMAAAAAAKIAGRGTKK